MGASDGDQRLRLGAAVPGAASAFQTAPVRKDRPTLGWRRHEPASPHQRLRRLEGGRRSFCGDARPRGQAVRHRRERDCTGGAEYPNARRGDRCRARTRWDRSSTIAWSARRNRGGHHWTAGPRSPCISDRRRATASPVGCSAPCGIRGRSSPVAAMISRAATSTRCAESSPRTAGSHGGTVESASGVAIVGCGLIGRKRAAALGGARLVACADTVPARASALARERPERSRLDRWEEAIDRPDVDLVIVATTNDSLTPIAIAAVEAGKHVLVEKPAARTVAELDRVGWVAERYDRRVQGGIQSPLSPGVSGSAATRRPRCARAADVRQGPLRPWRPRRLRSRMARRSSEGRRRGTDRSRRSPHRPGELVPRCVHRRPRRGDDVLLGHAGRRQRVHDPPDRRPGRRPFCT